MVIVASDSCNTFVGLANDAKDIDRSREIRKRQPSIRHYLSTELILPPEGYDSHSSEQTAKLHLPLSESVDEYLKTIPQVMEVCDELLSSEPRRFNRHSQERFLYVHQGEVAYATSLQCEVLVSDKATTCHILAVHSTTGTKQPLTSLTHIDGSSYEKCIREMFNQHKLHHGDEEIIQVGIHIAGGFDDDNGSSQEISNWLISLLAKISSQEIDCMKFSLRTCAISKMNDNGHASPIARGLGINLHTGQSFLARVDQDDTSPMLALRGGRLWSSFGDHDCANELSVLHTSTGEELTISPFYYKHQREMDILLALPDNVLLECTSTSPAVEDVDFCCNVRKTLIFMRDIECTHVFGSCCSESISFRRAGQSNMWLPVR